MGAVVTDSNKPIMEVPWLVRRITVTSGNTATAITHGETSAPDMILPMLTVGTTIDTSIEIVRDTSATTSTVQFNDDGNDTWELYFIWFSQASGGIS